MYMEILERVDGYTKANGEQIFNVVKDIICEIVDVESEMIKPDSLLMQELGMESLDLLDLLFSLERHYNIKIPRGGLDQKAREGLTGEEYAREGRLTTIGVERMRLLLPEVDSMKLVEGLLLKQIPTLFTPMTFVRLVTWQLLEKESQGFAGHQG